MTGTPFRVAIPQDALDDLHARLDRTRWPDTVDSVGWAYGTPRAYLQDLVGYWRHGFDWRAAEARINAFDQLRLPLDGLDLHCIHQRSPHVGATPLLLVHGWPGSIVEFLRVIPRLTEPEKFGGRAEDAFHVVCPSLPGYGFSAASPFPGMGGRQVAERHLALMSELGYERFVAQGGDWGSVTCRLLADLAPERVIGLHLNFVPTVPPKDVADPLALCTERERAALADWEQHQKRNTGYIAIQATRPHTLAYGLNDSPAGLCGWIAEKFHGWTDHGGDPRDAVSWDDLLTNVSLYWFTGTIGSSVRFYLEYFAGVARGEGAGERVSVPFGAAIYPKEMTRPPRAWVERTYNLVHWFEAERGGHFAALEQPDVFAADLRAFGATLRGRQQAGQSGATAE